MHTRPLMGVLLIAAVASSGAVAVQMPGVGVWERSLRPRDVNRDGTIDAYYDKRLAITWLADAAVGRTLGLPDRGKMEWDDAMAFVASFDLYGVTGWRLYKSFPIREDGGCTKVDTGLGTDCGFGVSPWTSEMAHLYYITLGNKGALDRGFDAAANSGPFSNITSGYHYWSETDFTRPSGIEAAWNFGGGSAGAYQDLGIKYRDDADGPRSRGYHHIWPVYDGDIRYAGSGDLVGSPVSGVPEPSSALLMLAGAIIILAAARAARNDTASNESSRSEGS